MKRFVFNKLNITTFVTGIILTILGYIIMAGGDHTISPILLTISYVIIFPLSIVIGFWKSDKSK